MRRNSNALRNKENLDIQLMNDYQGELNANRKGSVQVTPIYSQNASLSEEYQLGESKLGLIKNISKQDIEEPFKGRKTQLELTKQAEDENQLLNEQLKQLIVERKVSEKIEIQDQLLLSPPSDKQLRKGILKKQTNFKEAETLDVNIDNFDEFKIPMEEMQDFNSNQDTQLAKQITNKKISNLKTSKADDLKNDRFLDEIRVDDCKKLRKLKNYNYFIILPDDPFKQKWELFIIILLVFTAFSTPFRIAFFDDDNSGWTIVDSILDCSFGLDAILNFFMAYYNSEDEIVDNRRVIAKKYLKTWFFIDVSSIIPISQCLNTKNYSQLVRITRLPKLYRLFKIVRIMRLMKVVREKNNLIKYVNDLFRLKAGFERLITFITFSIIFCHISACFWVMIARFSDTNPDTWVTRCGYADEDNFSIYIASMYFILTTIVTVGFGDISGYTIQERIFCIAMMAVGVFAFSFSISALSSMLQSFDSRKAHIKKQITILNSIRRQYNVGLHLYRRLKIAVKYDHSKIQKQRNDFLNELPQILKIELSMIMYRELVKKIHFFKDMPAHFIAFIGPFLTMIKIEKGNYIYKEKDPIDEIFFLIKGKAALVHKDIKDAVYLIIEEGYYFGEIDFIFPGSDGKRKFTVKALEDCDLCVITRSDLAKIDEEYEEIIVEIFQNAQVRLKRTLKIKDESENYYLKKQMNYMQRQSTEEHQVHRMSTTMGVKNKESSQNNSTLSNALLNSSKFAQIDQAPGQDQRKQNPLNQIDEEDEEEQESEIKTDSTFNEKLEQIEEQEECENEDQIQMFKKEDDDEEKDNLNNEEDEILDAYQKKKDYKNNYQNQQDQSSSENSLEENQQNDSLRTDQENQEDNDYEDEEEDGGSIPKIHSDDSISEKEKKSPMIHKKFFNAQQSTSNLIKKENALNLSPKKPFMKQTSGSNLAHMLSKNQGSLKQKNGIPDDVLSYKKSKNNSNNFFTSLTLRSKKQKEKQSFNNTKIGEGNTSLSNNGEDVKMNSIDRKQNNDSSHEGENNEDEKEQNTKRPLVEERS